MLPGQQLITHYSLQLWHHLYPGSCFLICGKMLKKELIKSGVKILSLNYSHRTCKFYVTCCGISGPLIYKGMYQGQQHHRREQNKGATIKMTLDDTCMEKCETASCG